jgi:hypothetical protein
MEVSCQIHAPAALPPREMPRVPTAMAELNAVRREKCLAPCRDSNQDSSGVQHVAWSLYRQSYPGCHVIWHIIFLFSVNLSPAIQICCCYPRTQTCESFVSTKKNVFKYQLSCRKWKLVTNSLASDCDDWHNTRSFCVLLQGTGNCCVMNVVFRAKRFVIWITC